MLNKNLKTNKSKFNDEKITKIAEMVGYKDSDYFVRKFIEIKGCTPSKYRKNKND